VLKISLGVWDHVKNACAHSEAARTWDLTKVTFLPGKRESRRYRGAHVLTQNDIEREGRFDDVVAYGGWTMDDHHPAGFESFGRYQAPPTIHHPAPSPYGIPYGCLYSQNVPNLMFAGRNASCTHTAMSSTRVMGTACSMGQALGTAAALALREGVDPAGISTRMTELQQQLLADDAYLPGVRMDLPACMREAALEASQGDAEPLRDGIHRQVGTDAHAWVARPGDAVTVKLAAVTDVREVLLILDSAMEQSITLEGHCLPKTLPAVLPARVRVEVQAEAGAWETVGRLEDNWQRRVCVPVRRRARAVRVGIEALRGAPESRVYGLILNPLYGAGE